MVFDGFWCGFGGCLVVKHRYLGFKLIVGLVITVSTELGMG